MRYLVDEVVGRRHSRTFVLDQLAVARHETIEELYDARLLHVLRRGIVSRLNPGRLYDGFAIDYGCATWHFSSTMPPTSDPENATNG